MGASHERMAEVIQMLLDADFLPDGHTAVQHVRIPTRDNPLFGSLGGELATLGGRQRFAHPSGIKATVGRQTTYLYRVDKDQPSGTEQLLYAETKDVDRIRSRLDDLVHQAGMPHRP